MCYNRSSSEAFTAAAGGGAAGEWHCCCMIGFNGIVAGVGDEAGNQRRAGRFRIEGRSCELGKIEDISARGMRCRARSGRAPDGRLLTVLLPTDHGPVEATVRLIWTRKFGMFKRVVGVEFVDANEDVRRAAMQLASASSANFRMKKVAGT